MIRIAVVEDDPRLRAALVALLQRQSGFEVVGD
jgi:DNA-binding NarL/FixJ family response regulator